MSPRLCHAFALALSVATAGAEIDTETGLVKSEGWQEVRNHCGSCHSLDLLTGQRSSREGWRQTIRTMRDSHNMHELPTATEARIVGYLAEHYSPAARPLRRPPIPQPLMPR